MGHIWWSLMLVAALSLQSCERQPPTTQARAEALARSLVAKQGADWGAPQTVSLDAQPDQQGRRWWRIRYDQGPDGEPRQVAVNYHSGWVRFDHAAQDDSQPNAHHSQRSLVLVIDQMSVTEMDLDTRAQWDDQVVVYNQRAVAAAMPAAYSLRRAAHAWQLVWGWDSQAETGRSVAADTQAWLEAQHPQAHWVSLPAEGRASH